MSLFVPVCPLLSFLRPRTGTNRDKRGQTGTKRDISGESRRRQSTWSRVSETAADSSHQSWKSKEQYTGWGPLFSLPRNGTRLDGQVTHPNGRSTPRERNRLTLVHRMTNGAMRQYHQALRQRRGSQALIDHLGQEHMVN